MTDAASASTNSDDGPQTDGEPPSADPGPSAGPVARGACTIEIQNPCRYPDVAARQLRPFLERLVADLAAGARSLTVRFVSDREMRRLNATYRRRDKTTDVLSFPGDWPSSADEDGWPESGHLGDVAVAIPTARRQAAERGHDVAREIRLLALHGILHCLGHDHEQDDGEMETLEAELRRRYLPAPGAGPS